LSGLVELMVMFEVMAEREAVCGSFSAFRISAEALAGLPNGNSLDFGTAWRGRSLNCRDNAT